MWLFAKGSCHFINNLGYLKIMPGQGYIYSMKIIFPFFGGIFISQVAGLQKGWENIRKQSRLQNKFALHLKF